MTAAHGKGAEPVPPDPKRLVRDGYDALSVQYRGDDDDPPEYRPWLDRITAVTPAAAPVLDLGCGCGVPVTRRLTAEGFAVTGVDISPVQITRARELVPGATFVRADLIEATFRPASFDAICCFYALIHLPMTEQQILLGRVADWLRPGGLFITTVGHRTWTGRQSGWLGGDTDMWWSHPDAATYRTWIEAAGLDVIEEQFIPEASSGHQLFVATRR